MAYETESNSGSSFNSTADESEKIVQSLTELLSNTVEIVRAVVDPLTRTAGELNDRVISSVNDLLKLFVPSSGEKQ
jgi:hypothetical protein